MKQDDIFKFTKRLEAKIKNITEKQFRKYVEEFRLKVSGEDLKESVRSIVYSWLEANKEKSWLPNMYGTHKGAGNMLKHIIYDKFKASKLEFNRVGNNLTASFSLKWGIDTDGVDHTVVRDKKSGSGQWWYAEILNSNKKFKKYNGFKSKVSDNYRQSLAFYVEKEMSEMTGLSGSVYRY